MLRPDVNEALHKIKRNDLGNNQGISYVLWARIEVFYSGEK